MAAHQAPQSLGFSRQEHWSGLPFPCPMHESEKWKWSRSVMSYSSRPHGLQPTRLLHPWDFPGKSTGVGCRCLTLHDIAWLNVMLSRALLWSSLIAPGAPLYGLFLTMSTLTIQGFSPGFTSLFTGGQIWTQSWNQEGCVYSKVYS